MFISLFLCKVDQHRGFSNSDGPVRWPPRSPDLTPMNFFIRGEMKRLVYEVPLDTEEEMVARVTAAVMVIFQTSGIF